VIKTAQTKFNFNEDSVVMYHYVRPIKKSSLPFVKGIELEDFKRQLDLVESKSEVISLEVFKSKFETISKSTKPSILLTFDDGLKDHIDFVVPELLKRKMSAVFFVPLAPLLGHPLNVHKIQFILHNERSFLEILSDVKKFMFDHEIRYNMINKLIGNRYDSDIVAEIKFLLQRYLPSNLRSILIGDLFNKFVNISDSDFVNTLYMNNADIKYILGQGMEVGFHSLNHHWFSDLNSSEINAEISNPLMYFNENFSNQNDLSVAYPYGDFTPFAIKTYNRYGINFGFTTKPGFIDFTKTDRMRCARWDTNDIGF
jgi:peptidoglycan/xylan/chitin deacetylase (PgdA/CDA1 family)